MLFSFLAEVSENGYYETDEGFNSQIFSRNLGRDWVGCVKRAREGSVKMRKDSLSSGHAGECPKEGLGFRVQNCTHHA